MADKAPAAPAAKKEDRKGTSIRPLNEAEIAELHGDDTPPAEYANTTLNDGPQAEEKVEEEAPKTPPVVDAPPAEGDTFERLETELQKPEGKEDLSKFSGREKAYFHQMRRDRKARQQAEEERDRALFNLTKAKNPPPPPPDPLDGLADDDVLSVKEMKERLAKMPPAPPADAPPAGPKTTPQAVKYLQLCEKEARAAHPEDFDAVMELSEDLIAGDATALREIGEKTAAGDNPAEVMYETIKKHKDFQTLLPAAEVRAKARLNNAAKVPPASSQAPAATPTPEDKAKLDSAMQAEKALEENANRPKTTAHVSAREGKPAEELTLEEIGSMKDMDFAKLPRSVRNRYLKKYGA